MGISFCIRFQGPILFSVYTDVKPHPLLHWKRWEITKKGKLMQASVEKSPAKERSVGMLLHTARQSCQTQVSEITEAG